MKNVVIYYDEKRDFTRFKDCAEKTMLAVSRLENPYNLDDEDYVMYQDWLFGPAGETAKEFVDMANLEIFPLLVKYRVINRKNIAGLVEYAQTERKFDVLSFLLNASNALKNSTGTFAIAKKKTAGKIKPAVQIMPVYRDVKKGDILWLGKAPIPWVVLDKKDGILTLISKYALDCQPYNQIYNSVSWDTCTLRRWLNRDFVHGVFSDDEKDSLDTVYIGRDDVLYKEPVEGATEDKVYLLSIAEAESYFKSDDERRARVTAKAKGRIMWASFDVYGHWWLRSPSADDVGATYVMTDGRTFDHGGVILSNSYDRYFDHYGVRPVIQFRCKDNAQ